MSSIKRIEDIIDHVVIAVSNKLPFSLIRFGDGGLKIMHNYLNGNVKYHNSWRQEGIPMDYFNTLIRQWVLAANEADYIDSHAVYFEDDLHSKRHKTSQLVWDLMANWKETYDRIGINTDRVYCSSEAGSLLFLDKYKTDLVTLLEGCKVCCITNFYEIESILGKYFDVTVKLIPGFFGNHFDVCFKSIIEEIRLEANKYDIWLLGAGELGRIYSGEIRRCGGRCLDLGKTFNIWVNRKMDKRLSRMLTLSDKHELLFTEQSYE